MLMDLDELVEHWTLLDDERDLVAGKRGPTRLGFALILKFYSRHGRFPAGRSELPGEAVAFAGMTGTGQQLRAAEAELRHAGRDEVTGLVTLPIAALQFTDVRADRARMAAVCGSITGGRTWVAWSGRCFRFGVECRE